MPFCFANKYGRRFVKVMGNGTLLFHFTFFDSDLEADIPYSPDHFSTSFDLIPGIDRAVVQVERCPDSARAHLQGLVVFKSKICTRTGKNRIQIGFPTAHVEPAKKGIVPGYRYCTKTDGRLDGPFFFPEMWQPRGGQGQRNDILAAVATLRESGWDALVDQHTESFVRHHAGFARVNESITRRANSTWRDVRVLVLWGPPRTGKTRLAYSAGGDVYRLCLLPGTKQCWWGGYMNNQCVIIDDFYGQLPITYMQNVLDGHPLMTNVKGTHVYVGYKYVIITSNVHPDEWYTNPSIPPSVLDSFKARIHKIIHVDTSLIYNMLKENKIEDFF